MQIVYLSNRPAVLASTLAAVGRFMPWITTAMVCAPSGQHQAISRLLADAWPGDLTLVDDAAISGRSEAELQAMDHVTRNVTLRRGLIENDHTADTFILSDDDYRPLVQVPLTDFVGADGRHQGYFFYDLAEWPGDQTAFDQAQIRTLATLRILDRPTLAFGSHMPQVMTADRWRAAFAESDRVGAGNLVDEWSLYFNLSIAADPEAFTEPLPFRTLAWPQWPHQWPHWVKPHPIRFENHYPEHEEPGGLFAGLESPTSDAHALERIVRWREAELAIGELRFAKDWDDPWTRGKPHRRGAAAALRAAGKIRKYSGLGQSGS